MVYGILADHLSAAGTAMDCSLFPRDGTETGVHAGAVYCDPAAADRGLSLRENLGQRTRCKLRRRRQCASGNVVIPCLPGGTAFGNLGRAALSERLAVLLRVIARS